jgi:hypothetical protein
LVFFKDWQDILPIRKDENAVERIALDWNPQGTRKRGRPKKAWRRSIMEEAQRE